MAGPGIANGSVKSACSLVDLLPTIIDIACDTPPVLGQPIDGRSLLPMARGGAEDDGEAIGEYCAEMTASPVFMIRRGNFKYIHCDDNPAQLYDLEQDLAELVNLEDDPAHAALAEACATEVAARWDSGTIKTDVIAKQHQRRAVFDAMQIGLRADWDYNPPRDASQEYVRNHMDWTVQAARTRFPPLVE